MPAMMRPAGKPRKIAYQILGKPANTVKKSERQAYIDRKLRYEDTMKSK